MSDSDEFRLHTIKTVVETQSAEEADRYLAEGWVLLSLHVDDYGHPSRRHENRKFTFGHTERSAKEQFRQKYHSEYDSISIAVGDD